MTLEARAWAEEGFDQAVDAAEGQDAAALAAELRRRAENAERQADPWAEERVAYEKATTRTAVSDALAMPEGPPDPETAQRVGALLRSTADAVATSMRGSTIESMEDGVAGKGQLDSGRRWIDPRKAVREASGGALIDVDQATDTNKHEEEHNRQSVTADADAITVGGTTLEAWEVREAGAISVQQRIDFLSGHYRWIHSVLPVNAAERELIRQGQFRALEARKNGGRMPEPSFN